MAVGMAAGRSQHGEAIPGCGRRLGPISEHRAQGISALPDFIGRAADDGRAQNRCRGLSQGAGTYLLRKIDDLPIPKRELHPDGGAAKWRAPLGGPIGRSQGPEPWDVCRERKDAGRIELQKVLV